MNILRIFLLLGFIFINANFAEAKGIPYCTKKITRGCVKPKRGQTAKNYFAPKYNEYSSKWKSKKIAKNTNPKKIKKAKRGTASVIELKLNKKKKKK